MKPKKVGTPGSYDLGKTTPPRKKVGRPGSTKKAKVGRKWKARENYTEEDVQEAVRLVKTMGYSIMKAAKHTNNVKKNAVPRMTLSDRLKRALPSDMPALGRPQELSAAVEEALVKCLELCAEFNYPMRKRDLQDLVQNYCVEKDVKTRWPEDRPGKAWIRNFRRRWRHRVRVRKPTNIKRSHAKVSPADVRAFFERIQPNLEGIPAKNIFNYDETCFRDDPGAEDAFFGGGCKYFEQVQNHSKVTVSVMMAGNADGELMPPMTVFKSSTGSVYQSWCEGGPDGATYAATKSGWFDMEKFNQWFKQVCYHYLMSL
jgi:transposase-like protein